MNGAARRGKKNLVARRGRFRRFGSMFELPFPPDVKDLTPYIEGWQSLRKRLNEVLESVPAEKFKTPPSQGGWSASQLAEHLYLVQIQFSLAVPAALSGKFGYEAKDMPIRDYAQITYAMQAPIGIKNPDAVTPETGFDKEKSLTSLRRAMDRMVKALNGHTPGELRGRAMDHAIFGRLDLLEWLFVLALHEKQHLTAVERKYGQD